MIQGLSFVYDLAEAEIVVRDLLAAPATYTYGQALKFGVTDGTDRGCVVTAGAGTGLLAAVSNEGGFNITKTLAGTVAAGTVETLKCIVNPNAVYRIEYDVSSPITWASANDTSITFNSAGAGWANLGGGWAWSYNTGELDWIVSSSVAGGPVTTLVTVTGTGTTSTTGILMQAQGRAVITLNSAATKIAAGALDIGVAGTNGFDCVVLGNVMLSQTYAYEKLNPATNSDANTQGTYNISAPSTTPTNRMNRAIRYMASQTTDGKTMDKAKAYADVWLGLGSAFSQLIITT